MKKQVIRWIGMAAAVLVLLGGCTAWPDGAGYSVTPHLDDNSQRENQAVVISSYDELRRELEDLVGVGSTKKVIYYQNLDNEAVQRFLNRAVHYIKTEYPLGAYAVDDISYEVGSSSGKPAVALEITYHHNRSEILRIKKANSMEAAQSGIIAALENCDATVVLLVDNYESADLTQFVQDYMDQNPDTCMEMPQVSVAMFPEEGSRRVIEMQFSYQTSRETLRAMQDTVQTVFNSAKLYVSGDAGIWQKYGQLYSFLMERYDYKLESSITPAYSLLHHGVGDCKAFATVYACMCERSGLDCRVVSGSRDGEAWYWNVICQDGEFYYLDLLNSGKGFVARSADEMNGYVWDYSAY